MILAFFEYPSSIKLSSDFRFSNTTVRLYHLPCGTTEAIEIICLVIFLINWLVQYRLAGWRRFIRQPWWVLYSIMVIISFIDLIVSLTLCFTFGQSSFGATLRIRRYFRPFFFLVPSSMMKKFIKAVGRTVIQIFSVLVLLALHIYIFAMIGMLIFPKPIISHFSDNSTNLSLSDDIIENGSIPSSNDTQATTSYAEREGRKYFTTVEDSIMSLLVFLTTANNPDVMTTIYKYNRLSFIYFFLFLSIGLYLILNLLTAAVYSEFRGYIEKSMQASFVRRRVAYRAAFEVLARRTNGGKFASKELVRQLLKHDHADLPKSQLPSMYALLETVNIHLDSVSWEEFRNIFDLISKDSTKLNESNVQYYSRFKLMTLIQKLVRHNAFIYFTIGITIIHVVILTVEMEVDYGNVVHRPNSPLAYVNFIFFFYYIFELVVKLTGLGLKIYFKSFANIFEGVVTMAIIITEIVSLISYGHPINVSEREPPSYSTLIRFMNLFIVFRLLRIIPQFTSVSFVFGTMIEILKNLRAFAGIIIVIYYLFALVGMSIFGGNTKLEDVTERFSMCGLYEHSEYFGYNFHDFAASLVLLWNIMVVNNWYVFLEAFSYATSKWSQLYFIAWWLVSVIITVNLFISLVIEVFLKRWEIYHETRKRQASNDDLQYLSSTEIEEDSYRRVSTASDIRIVLQRNLTEPAESELQHELHKHRELL